MSLPAPATVLHPDSVPNAPSMPSIISSVSIFLVMMYLLVINLKSTAWTRNIQPNNCRSRTPSALPSSVGAYTTARWITGPPQECARFRRLDYLGKNDRSLRNVGWPLPNWPPPTSSSNNRLDG